MPFDPRLICRRAAGRGPGGDGNRRRPPADRRHGGLPPRSSAGRLDPTASWLQLIFDRVRRNPSASSSPRARRSEAIRAASAFRDSGYGTPMLIGREEQVRADHARASASPTPGGIEIHNARLSERNAPYTEFLYRRLQRNGLLCTATASAWSTRAATCSAPAWWRTATRTRMVTGLTRSYRDVLEDVLRVIDAEPGQRRRSASIVVLRHGRTVFIADTASTRLPDARAAGRHRQPDGARWRASMGHRAARRVALLLQLRQPAELERTTASARRCAMLDSRKVDFEYDGEMQADVALDYELMRGSIRSAASPARPTC